jgi:hypothetical protein
MGFNLKTISQSWFDSYFGTNEQKLLAQERLKVCDTCPSREELFKNKNWSVICGECGCPLSKKIFSKKIKECPLDKWKEVDSNSIIFSKKVL